MGKKWWVPFVFLVFFACKKKEPQAVETESDTVSFSFQQMPKMADVNPEVSEILEEWEAFQALTESFQVLFKASNNEDLALAIDDLLEKEKLLRESEYPKAFETSEVMSRQKVFRTFLLKIQASLADRTDVFEPMKQMLLAYNAMRNQFNIITNNKLDIDLILDEN